MSLLGRRHIEADLAAVKDLLDRLPPENWLDRAALEVRQAELREQAAKLDSALGQAGQAVLLFGGQPVVGARGIEAPFATAVLAAYQDLVSASLAAKETGRPLRSSGPIPLKDVSRLHITNVIHGSFGFELRELADEQEILLGATPLSEAMNSATTLMVAAGESDEQLVDAIEDTDARVTDSLRKFFDIINRFNATFKIVTNSGEHSFDSSRVKETTERIDLIQKTSEDTPISGV